MEETLSLEEISLKRQSSPIPGSARYNIPTFGKFEFVKHFEDFDLMICLNINSIGRPYGSKDYNVTIPNPVFPTKVRISELTQQR